MCIWELRIQRSTESVSALRQLSPRAETEQGLVTASRKGRVLAAVIYDVRRRTVCEALTPLGRVRLGYLFHLTNVERDLNSLPKARWWRGLFFT